MGLVRKFGPLTAGAALLILLVTAGIYRSKTAALPACATQRPPDYDVRFTPDPLTPASAPPASYPPASAPEDPAPGAPDLGSEMDALMGHIGADSEMFARSGVFVSGWGPDTSTGKIVVTLPDPTAD